MGSDTQAKSTNTWSKVKISLTILASFALVARIAFSGFSNKKATNDVVSKKPATVPPAAPVISTVTRPAADAPEYDPYFVNVAPDFVVGSDFDIGKLLQKQGFRVTKNKAKDMLKSHVKGSVSEEFILSHHALLSADWASQGVEAVPLLHHSILDFDGKSKGFPNKALLETKIRSLTDHAFFVDVSSVVTPRMTTTSTEKYIFMYDNHTWNMDSMNPIKFIHLLELFAERTFHGAWMKETVDYKQTAMQPMMPQHEVFESGIKQSFILMPRYYSPQMLRDTCHREASNNITENLDQPIELKVLVLWGKAYMATCYASICNPFVGTLYTPAQGPRYVAYPDGQSNFLEGKAEGPGEIKCAEAVDDYIKSKLRKAFTIAEKVAKTLGAPWLRVDLFLDDKAKEGAVLHRVRSANTAVSGWVSRSDRAMAIVARGFENRGKVKGLPPKSQSSVENLKALGCVISPAEGSRLHCRSKRTTAKLPGSSGASIASP